MKVRETIAHPPGHPTGSVLAQAANPHVSLNGFRLDDLATFTREHSFPANDSPDFRVLYAGRDDVHGALAYLLARCSRSLRFNMFGYDDDALDQIVRGLVASEHVFVQGTLDKSQAAGVHERKILAGWDQAMRNSFAIGQSATHQISHTKGGVIDGVVAWEGSTNWSASGEGTIVATDGSDVGRKSQNNTCAFYVHPVQVARFIDELDHEHAVALAQQTKAAAG
ncbi:MAG: hypothetical protein ACRDNS_10035 [Trebonia sp.]